MSTYKEYIWIKQKENTPFIYKGAFSFHLLTYEPFIFIVISNASSCIEMVSYHTRLGNTSRNSVDC